MHAHFMVSAKIKRNGRKKDRVFTKYDFPQIFVYNIEAQVQKREAKPQEIAHAWFHTYQAEQRASLVTFYSLLSLLQSSGEYAHWSQSHLQSTSLGADRGGTIFDHIAFVLQKIIVLPEIVMHIIY